MECNVPTDIVFSFTGFAMRGGKTGPHADGWGVALYEGKFAHTFLEPKPACTSAMAEFIRQHPIKTLLSIAHVRKKTRGARHRPEHAPVQARAVGAPLGVRPQRHPAPHQARASCTTDLPIGETDSEHAFCWMLQRLRKTFPGGYPKRPAPPVARHRGDWGPSWAPRASSTSCWPTASTSTRAAEPSSATSCARRRSGAPRCATPRWRSTSPR